MAYFGLYALQHRGQESAGIATSDGEQQRFYKEMGLVAQVFTEDILRQPTGHIACDHNRYSTTGGSRSRTPSPSSPTTATWGASSSPTTGTWSTPSPCASPSPRRA